jgi:hypothetical protein
MTLTGLFAPNPEVDARVDHPPGATGTIAGAGLARFGLGFLEDGAQELPLTLGRTVGGLL